MQEAGNARSECCPYTAGGRQQETTGWRLTAEMQEAGNARSEWCPYTAGGRLQKTPGWRLKAEMQENRKPGMPAGMASVYRRRQTGETRPRSSLCMPESHGCPPCQKGTIETDNDKVHRTGARNPGCRDECKSGCEAESDW